MGRGELHELPSQQAVTAPMTALSATALASAEVPGLVARAFSLFAGGRPRPVHLAFPIDLLAEPAFFEVRPHPLPVAAVPADRLIDEAAALMRQASRPVIVAGGGSLRAAPYVLAVAERLGAAVIQTRASKGVVPGAHPLSLGATLQRPATRQALAEADVVIAIGTELAATDHWAGRLQIGGRLVRIDLDPAALVRDYVPALALLGDAGMALEGIIRRLGPKPDAPPGFWAGDALERIRRENAAALTPKQRRQAVVLDVLREALPENGFVAADSTQLAYTGNAWFPCAMPRSWFFPVGYGTLGFALPAAIGAKIAAPERPGAVITGDGGFLFTAQELATAVELRVPLAVLLWNNDAYGQIRDDMEEAGIPRIGVALCNPDFLALARAFGCHAARPESLLALREAIRGAFSAQVPTIIEVREDAAYLA